MEVTSENILNHQWRLQGNFNKQVAEILRSIQLPPSEVGPLPTLYDDIEDTSARLWPGCKAKPFGSLVTGLALKDSDADCFLALPANCGDSPETCVKKMEDLINNSTSPFREAHAIIKKVSTVKFFHPKTGMYCDLSFNRAIALEFGKLVNYCVTVDDRIPKLMLLIKYWAKRHKLTGTKVFPSNALIILIVFFLQLKKILPPVSELQKTGPAFMVEGWNTGFTEISYKNTNTQSVYNLLREFFTCYAKFDFRNLIVCPYLGYGLERDTFLHLKNLPRAFETYRNNLNRGICEKMWLNCIMCVQDPFDHSRNCAGPVKPQVAGDIIQYFKDTVHVFNSTTKLTVLNEMLNLYTGPQQKSSTINTALTPNHRQHLKRRRVGRLRTD